MKKKEKKLVEDLKRKVLTSATPEKERKNLIERLKRKVLSGNQHLDGSSSPQIVAQSFQSTKYTTKQLTSKNRNKQTKKIKIFFECQGLPEKRNRYKESRL